MTSRTILILFLLLLLVGIYYWMFLRKPEKISGPFPDDWRNILEKEVRYYQRLTPEEKKQFERTVQDFLDQTQITGVGTTVDDIDRLLVAASAVIPIFGFPEWNRYPNLREVLLYPNTFNPDNFQTQGQDRDVLGMVGWGFMNGQMILSKPALHRGFEQAGRSNVGIHEFVHLMDKTDGATDGIPENLLAHQYVIPWLRLIREEIEAIREDRSDISAYGGTNEAEFFAVAAEYFFQRPHQLERKHPELFDMLERIFHQDLDEDGRIG